MKIKDKHGNEHPIRALTNGDLGSLAARINGLRNLPSVNCRDIAFMVGRSLDMQTEEVLRVFDNDTLYQAVVAMFTLTQQEQAASASTRE